MILFNFMILSIIIFIIVLLLLFQLFFPDPILLSKDMLGQTFFKCLNRFSFRPIRLSSSPSFPLFLAFPPSIFCFQRGGVRLRLAHDASSFSPGDRLCLLRFSSSSFCSSPSLASRRR